MHKNKYYSYCTNLSNPFIIYGLSDVSSGETIVTMGFVYDTGRHMPLTLKQMSIWKRKQDLKNKFYCINRQSLCIKVKFIKFLETRYTIITKKYNFCDFYNLA